MQKAWLCLFVRLISTLTFACYLACHVLLQMPVRPFKHNEYERFLVCAYPYYASALSGMLAFFALGWFFLYHK